jgi:hypothetical protein
MRLRQVRIVPAGERLLACFPTNWSILKNRMAGFVFDPRNVARARDLNLCLCSSGTRPLRKKSGETPPVERARGSGESQFIRSLWLLGRRSWWISFVDLCDRYSSADARSMVLTGNCFAALDPSPEKAEGL